VVTHDDSAVAHFADLAALVRPLAQQDVVALQDMRLRALQRAIDEVGSARSFLLAMALLEAILHDQAARVVALRAIEERTAADQAEKELAAAVVAAQADGGVDVSELRVGDLLDGPDAEESFYADR
jgi:carbamoylphosphate synthase small subunit